jgi:hypothetical protein
MIFFLKSTLRLPPVSLNRRDCSGLTLSGALHRDPKGGAWRRRRVNRVVFLSGSGL